MNDRIAEQALLSVAEKVGFAVSGKHRKAELRDCHIRYENNATTPHVDGPPKELVLHFTLRGAEPEYLTPSDADQLMEPNFDISFTEKDPEAVKAATKTTTPGLVHCFLGQCADAPDFPRLVHWSPRPENEPQGVVGHDERAIFLARFAFQQTDATKAATQSWNGNNFRFWA